MKTLRFVSMNAFLCHRRDPPVLREIIHVAGGSSGGVLTFFAGMCVICRVFTEEGDGKLGRLPSRIKAPSPVPVFLFLLPG